MKNNCYRLVLLFNMFLVSLVCLSQTSPNQNGFLQKAKTGSLVATAESNHQESLRGAINLMIEMLENKKFGEFVERFMSPKYRARISKTRFLRLKRKFIRRGGDPRALKLLKSVKNSSIVFSRNNKIARIRNSRGKRLTFENIKGKWYIGN